MQTDILKTDDDQALCQRRRAANRAVDLGLGFNILLAAGKTLAGIAGHSQALLADGINSTSDVAYYLVVKVFVWLSGKPADREHPYGHHQYESIASVVVGAFVVATAIAIFWDSANKAYDLAVGRLGKPPIALFTLAVALATVAVKIFLAAYTRRVGARTKNPALMSLARDHRNDIFSALAASVGIFLGMRGLLWVDPVAGALVSLVILKTGIDILRESSTELMDTVPGEPLAREVGKILGDVGGVEEVEEVHAHRFGPYYVINLTIGVRGEMTVSQGDRIATEAEQILCRRMELVRKVYVHYHPAGAKKA